MRLHYRSYCMLCSSSALQIERLRPRAQVEESGTEMGRGPWGRVRQKRGGGDTGWRSVRRNNTVLGTATVGSRRCIYIYLDNEYSWCQGVRGIFVSSKLYDDRNMLCDTAPVERKLTHRVNLLRPRAMNDTTSCIRLHNYCSISSNSKYCPRATTC